MMSMMLWWVPFALGAPASGRVSKVYDGDTFTLESGDRVRLGLVNTPELRPPEPFGVEAGNAARELILNRRVSLSYGAVERDGYGRLIARAAVGDTDLSAYLVSEGLAHVFLIPPVAVDPTELLALEAQAREAQKGIWSLPAFQGGFHLTSFHANPRGDESENPNLEYFRMGNVSGRAQSLKGFGVVRKRDGKQWILPDVTVPAGHTVLVLSGQGEDQTDPTRQLTVHLGSAIPVWSNKGDGVTVLDPAGKVVDAREYAGKKR